MVAQVILVEAQPAQVSTGGAVTVRLAGGGGARPFDYSGQSDWRAGIRGLPTMIASLEYRGGEFPAGSVPSAAAVEWQGSSRALLATLSSYLWTDAPVTVRVGPEGALPPVLISGKVLAATADGGKLTLALADPAAALKKPLLTARFAGTGGLEGPVEWAGLIRKRVWGRVWNLAGEPIDKANNIYCFADPLRPIQAFDAVRDKGANAAALTILLWQGSAAATFAALQTAIAPAGGGVVCPSIACVKWWTQPAGELCADLRGEVGGVYVETTAEIVWRLVEAIGGPPFAFGTLTAAKLARPAPVGWLADDDSTTVAAMLDELLGNSSLLWLLDDAGAIVLREWTWGASVASATSQDVSRKEVLRPLATRKLGYKRNENVMQRGDLAAIVLSSDVAYLDGTPIENLKPAQVGADKTATNTAAAIAGQQWAATNGTEAAVSNARAPFGAGQNRVRFSLFEKGNTGWGVRYNPAGLGVAQTAFFNNGLRIGKIEWTYTGAGQVVSMGTLGGERYRIPVTPGEYIYVSMGTRALGGVSSLTRVIGFMASDGVTGLTSYTLPTNTGALLGGILQKWEGFVQVPAGCYFAYLEVYAFSSGAGAASLEIAQPMVIGAIAGQTAFPQFSPGPGAEWGGDITAENASQGFFGQGELATLNAVGSAHLSVSFGANLAPHCNAGWAPPESFFVGGWNPDGISVNAVCSAQKGNFGYEWSLNPDESTWGIYQPNGTRGSWGISDYYFKWLHDVNTIGNYVSAFPVAPGQRIEFSVYAGNHRSDPCQLGFAFYDSAGNQLAFTQTGNSISNGEAAGGNFLSGYKRLWTRGVAPAGAISCLPYVRKGHTLSGQADSWLFLAKPMICVIPDGQTELTPWTPGGGTGIPVYSNAQTFNQLRPEEFGSNKTETRIAQGLWGSGSLAYKNFINPASSDMSAVGSIPPHIPDNSFTYTSTTSTVTISWPALTIYRADGTTVAVSSGSVTISSLGAGSTYRVYPYVADSGGASGSIAFVGGGTGSPGYCFAASGSAAAAAQMNARGNIPMGAFYIGLPTAGSGGGGGGGSANCLHPDMIVSGKRAGDLCLGDMVITPTGLAPIRFINRQVCSEWFALYSGEIEVARVTRGHLFYLALTNDAVRVQDLRLGDLLASAGDHIEVTGMRLIHEVAELVGIELDAPHLHFVGPRDLLTHNGLAKP